MEDLVMVNEEHCPKHNLFYTGQCGPCARETYDKSQRKVKVFRYEVIVYENYEAFHKEVPEAGKEGMELIAFGIHPHLQDQAQHSYVAVWRVHRTD